MKPKQFASDFLQVFDFLLFSVCLTHPQAAFRYLPHAWQLLVYQLKLNLTNLQEHRHVHWTLNIEHIRCALCASYIVHCVILQCTLLTLYRITFFSSFFANYCQLAVQLISVSFFSITKRHFSIFIFIIFRSTLTPIHGHHIIFDLVRLYAKIIAINFPFLHRAASAWHTNAHTNLRFLVKKLRVVLCCLLFAYSFYCIIAANC